MAQAQRQKPPSIEEYWEILHARSEEYERQRKEADLRYESQREEFERKREEDKREQKEKWDRMDKMFAETNKKIGELGNSFGDLAEHLVAPGITERFREIGFVMSKTYPNVEIGDENGKTLTEVDFMLENGECIMAVEVKARIKMGDIDRHKARLEILRGWHDRNGDRRKIMGALAGAVFGSLEREAAIAEGFYVIVQSGDTMKIEIPEGFVPSQW